MNKGQTLGRAAVSLTILLALPTMLGAVAQSDPQTPFFCGIHAGGNYGVFDQGIQLLPDTAFEFYESINANWIGFGVTMALEDSMDSTVGFTNEDSQYPAFEEWEIRQFVQAAKERGFQIYLQLSLTMNAEQEYGKRTEGHNLGYPLAWQEIPALTRENWPWDPTHPDHEAFVAEFFASYTAMVLHYARIAEEEGIGMLAVGIELNSLFRTRSDDGRWSTEFRDEIKGMVDAVREVYSGLITLSLIHI